MCDLQLRLKMNMTEQLSESLEDYLEAIFIISSENGEVRSKDIVDYFGVKPPSVTGALHALAKTNHIKYQPYKLITITPKGIKQAENIIKKHEGLKSFFMNILGADSEVAEEDACKIEHSISESLLSRLLSFTEYIQACPECKCNIPDRFNANYQRMIVQ